jgi:predicted enzyme related to lactoylglutathione lyase
VPFGIPVTQPRFGGAFYSRRRRFTPRAPLRMANRGNRSIAQMLSEMWIGYICVDDVDAAADRIERLGGAVHVRPQDILYVSRFSVVSDPQMATFALFKWQSPGNEQPINLRTRGHVGWHELLADDWEKAWAIYSELFGWQKAEANVGAMGAYQQFSAGGQTIGGMMTKPPTVPVSCWLYYFNVGDIDAALKRVKAGGGQVLRDPIEVLDSNLDRPMRGPIGRHLRAGRPPRLWVFRAPRIASGSTPS